MLRHESRRVRAYREEPAVPDVPAVPAGYASQRARWLGAAAVLVLIFVAGGPVALVVPALAYLAWRRPHWLSAVALAGMGVSGLLVAMAAQPTGGGLGAFGAPAQACALVGLAAALMPALTSPAGVGRLARRAGR